MFRFVRASPYFTGSIRRNVFTWSGWNAALRPSRCYSNWPIDPTLANSALILDTLGVHMFVSSVLLQQVQHKECQLTYWMVQNASKLLRVKTRERIDIETWSKDQFPWCWARLCCFIVKNDRSRVRRENEIGKTSAWCASLCSQRNYGYHFLCFLYHDNIRN